MAPFISVQQAFQSLLNALELTGMERAEAVEHQHRLRENLRNNLTLDRDFLSGSLARQTAIRPLHDIDLVLVLNPKAHADLLVRPPIETLQLIRNTLIKIYPRESPPIVQSRSIGLNFHELDFGYDIVPVFQCDDDYLVPDKDSNKWLPCNPDRHKAYSIVANELTNNLARPLIKLLKHWNTALGKPVKSFHLELMAYNVLRGFQGTFLQGLVEVFSKLADAVLSPCPVPDGLSAPLKAENPHGAREHFRKGALMASQALTLTEGGRTSEAHYVYRLLMGSQYPATGREPIIQPSHLVAAPLIKSAVDAPIQPSRTAAAPLIKRAVDAPNVRFG